MTHHLLRSTLGAALLASPLLAQQDARDLHQKLVEEHVAAKLARSAESTRIRQSAAYRQAVETGDFDGSRKLLAKLPDTEAAMRPRFEAARARFKGTPGEAWFLAWLLDNVMPPRGQPSPYAQQLLERHADHEIWKTLAPNARYFFGKDPSEALATLLAKTPFDEVRVWVRYGQARTRLRSKSTSEEQRKLAQAELDRIVREHPDSIPAMTIAAPQFQKEHLQVGMKAPDIEGVDLDGKAFRLTDYRGKVVLLDFWGDW
ncbi:MAG: peroxiredoxin family protein [Planctomycetota bacterium]